MNNNFSRSSRPHTPARSSGPRSGRSFSRSSARPFFNRSGSGARPNHRPHSNARPQRRGFAHKSIDVTRFINKTVVTEEAVVFTPEHAFNDFHVDERLKKIITDRGFTSPTPIQDKIIPYILQGKDVVGMANTGTGKTAAFLIPLIHKVLLDPKQSVIIMAPTRELATQINDELIAFTKGLNISSVVCVGGASMSQQIRGLRQRVNFLIGTPGRIKDLINQGYIPVDKFHSVVLDEADRMLDMGFIADMKFIVHKMPPVRHGLFFSATLSKEIEVLIKDFLKDPMTISVKTQEISKNIEQDVVRVPREQRFDTLCDMLRQPDFTKVLIFGQTKHGVEKLSKHLSDKGFLSGSIHGNKTQSQRQKTLDLFKSHKLQILVATDVAARGLDINDVSHVINYDIPQSHEDYVHRIGRTGRGHKKGKALTFV